MTVVYIESAALPTHLGEFVLHGFEDPDTGKEHVALTMGEVTDNQPVLCRLHSECLTGDALFSLRCDCGPQLEAALTQIAEEGRGMLLYLRQEGRGIGLINKIRAYKLQDGGADTVEANERLGFDADLRDYSMCKFMFAHFQIQRVRLMTNNPLKTNALTKLGIEVVDRIPLLSGHNDHNARYLATKAGKLGHLLNHQD
ncbi:MAG: GTP cyclohydrolase II [Gammaproteobacteria bacterium]|mgnify:FL=1|uniref:GTP cyclohydrolase-2 n=1 Tax=OM182 bacterium MED-G24 TaxID=1986255 RepID=A0A2A5WV61_9GAMM|nr:GTP cyclohydrolase II [Gammaproteobacteria bacterium]PDH40311.1 MAG: GTP cyclohydrolase II [OM182 bacterium MED-G24]RPG23123.1 MAG: GTP cyclohydrolase II [Gammaproteobacteria bacterium TMED50]